MKLHFISLSKVLLVGSRGPYLIGDGLQVVLLQVEHPQLAQLADAGGQPPQVVVGEDEDLEAGPIRGEYCDQLTNHSTPGHNTHPLDQSEVSIVAMCGVWTNESSPWLPLVSLVAEALVTAQRVEAVLGASAGGRTLVYVWTVRDEE